MKSKEPEFVERRNAARDAKAALLAKAKARANDPAVEARRAERAAIAEAREKRQEAKRQESERLKREAHELQMRQEAERLAAEEAAKTARSNDLVAKLVEDEAARKAMRDARYAARQARKG